MVVSRGSETPVPKAMTKRAASSIGKFTASAPISVPVPNRATAATNNARVGKVRTRNGEVGIATDNSSRYPVVSHCTTSADSENSLIRVAYEMLSDVSDRMPRKVRTDKAMTTTMSRFSPMV